jgi:hypothetical protein
MSTSLQMKDIERCLTSLTFSAFYISEYKNGLSKLLNQKGNKDKRDKKDSLKTAKSTLTQQVKSTVFFIKQSLQNNNIENIYLSVNLTKYHFDTVDELFSIVWPNDVIRCRANTHNKSRLYDIASTIEIDANIENTRGGTAYCYKKTEEVLLDIETQGKLDVMLIRFFVAKDLFNEAIKLLKLPVKEGFKNKLERTITFEPEFLQSGISILSYFSQILAKKYPEADVKVNIEQVGNIVTLIIETQNGSIERITQELSEYGMVVVGDKNIHDYFQNPLDQLRLQNKLDLAKLESKQTYELLYTERNQFTSRIDDLEEQVQFMRKIFTIEQNANQKTTESIRELSKESNSSITESVKQLIILIEKGIEKEDEQDFKQNILTVQKEDSNIFDGINELLIKGAIQGTSGNYLYAWLKSLTTIV